MDDLRPSGLERVIINHLTHPFDILKLFKNNKLPIIKYHSQQVKNIILLARARGIDTPALNMFELQEHYYNYSDAEFIDKSMNLVLSNCPDAAHFIVEKYCKEYDRLIEEYITELNEEMYNILLPKLSPLARTVWRMQQHINKLEAKIEELQYMPGSLEAQMAAERFKKGATKLN